MLEKFLLRLPANIYDALRVIDAAAGGIALVVDDGGHLIGTLSDGDIRRGLLRGKELSAPVDDLIQQNCYSVSCGMSRAQVLDIMSARHFSQVPVVDGNNVLTGIHLLQDFLQPLKRSTPALVMAGGRGTRLGTLTRNIPKPLLKVAGRPILERIILHLISHGIVNIYLAVNYLAEKVQEHFKDGSGLGCSIRYLHEERELGSGGALSLLPELDEPVVTLNGDLIVEADISGMIDFHLENHFYATMGYSGYEHEVPYGCIGTEDARLIQLYEKPTLRQKINAGVYVLSPEAVKNVPADTFFPITRLFEQALEKQWNCGAFPLNGEWIDIGQKEQLAQARGE